MHLNGLAPAKINLGLHVVRRRPDGFRDIRTVFLRIPWADRVSVTEADALSMSCSDSTLPTDHRNLCMRAAQALIRACGGERGAHIHLEKHIPYGAGLGGGSSDAATTLRLLNEMWSLEMAPDELAGVAASLGSDVPFFLGPVAAVGEGKGEVLTPLLTGDGSAYALPYTLVVVMPQVSVGTAEAYEIVVPREERGAALDRASLEQVVLSNDLGRWRRELINDFQTPILDRYPTIAEVYRMLDAAGAGYVSLTGSGAAVYGVFDSDAAAQAAAEAARLEGLAVWSG